MRIAIVSDVHGNLTALEAVIADLHLTAPDLVLHGGDLAANGSNPAEVVDRIRDLGWLGVCGNTDEMLWNREALTNYAAKFPKLRSILAILDAMIPWTCAALGEHRIRWLQAQPAVQHQSSLALVHASPGNFWQAPLSTAADRELQSVYQELRAPMVVYAHIHRPYVRRLEGMAVANTGSVSLSYDGDPRASYLLLDDAEAVIRRVEYDLEREGNALVQSGVPHAAWLARTLRAGTYVPPAS